MSLIKFINKSFISLLAGFALTGSLMLLFFRCYQACILCTIHVVPENHLLLQGLGLLLDIVVWMTWLMVVAIPARIIMPFSQKLVKVLLALAMTAFLLTEVSLFEYFRTTLTLLDQVIFSYSPAEMVMIARSSVPTGLFTFLPLIVMAVLLIPALWLALTIILPERISVVILYLMPGSMLVFFFSQPGNNCFSTPFNYHITTNKTGFLAGKTWAYLRQPGIPELNEVTAATKRYHKDHPEARFIGLQYPFIREDQTPDVLSPFFSLKTEKPNLVFLIVESLSMSFIGTNDIFGSFTPFLDSLANHSLVWNNCLSTSDRTFNVLPALFGSLPPGDPSIMEDIGKLPYHFSLIRLLQENGYHTSFFYGGDPAFNNMDGFLKKQKIGYILRHFGSRYQKQESGKNTHTWGYSDGDLYRRSMEVIDSLSTSPRLDIYLTLSLHAPFLPPDREHYRRETDRRRREMSPVPKLYNDSEIYKDIFATILYTDHALRECIAGYRKRADFHNTIFVITGDHALPELNFYRFSPLLRYNVPLMIYSPMLRRPGFMRAVNSHLDIAPSVTAMLREKYAISPGPYIHWLGNGIDTSTAPRNLHTLAFIQNNKEISEIIDKDHYLWNDRCYTVLPEAWLEENHDKELCREMKRKLHDFKILNSYVTSENKLVPPEVFFRKRTDGFYLADTDTIRLDTSDMNGEFRSLLTSVPLPEKISYLELTLRLKYKTPLTDPALFPMMVLDLQNYDGQCLHWQAFPLVTSPLTVNDPGRWHSLAFNTHIQLDHLSGLKTGIFKLYLWNHKHSHVRFANPDLVIKGFY